MKKKNLFLIVALGLLMITGSAMAYTYDFTFSPPYSGCMNSTGLNKLSGGTPYVYPKVSSTPTSYYLASTPYSGLTEVTNYIVNISTPGKRYFTYNSGEGYGNKRYCLSGYPTNYNFSMYNVYGDWQP